MHIAERLNPTFAPGRAAVTDSASEARDRLIVALDVPNAKAAADLLERLEGTCNWFKVGMELFTACGPSVIELLLSRERSVFLDLKFHDIPNTVAGAVRSAAALGVRMVNVHAGGGPAMLEAARNALAGLTNPPQLLAVTLLTSMNESQLKPLAIRRTPAKQVELLARMSIKAGIKGFVCSAEEVAALRALTGPDGVLVIPGIRPAGADRNDQRRMATPAAALQRGASYLVVGRPITQAPDPASAAETILAEMATAIGAAKPA